ncbi:MULTISPECIES: type III secretion system chaperone [unclassified Pseudomonas]|uniref:type III secretion system chaperone n=1 Tax=unclassified Pseudomonas TaxID=196821 RepID=UPI0025D3CFD0|nr:MULTISPECIES: type III secretion system chaperone [unclassified Pseudomonas]
MTNADTLIAALGTQLNTPLTLENGVCALFDQDREVAIIEVSPAGDVAVVHCKLLVRPDPGMYERLLRLNFDTGVMHGCWLALDERSEVRLCAETSLQQMGQTQFVHWVQGFVRQTREMPGLLRTGHAGMPKPTAPRPSLGALSRSL